MSKTKHPLNMALLTQSEHILSNFAHICPANKSVEGPGKRLVLQHTWCLNDFNKLFVAYDAYIVACDYVSVYSNSVHVLFFQAIMINRPALMFFPPMNFTDLLNSSLMSVSILVSGPFRLCLAV